MRFKLLLAGLVSAFLFSAQAANERGWQTLFDGKSTNGWEMIGPGELRLEHGELVTYGGMGMLWYSQKKFGNCQIKVVFKLSKPNDNSGVFVRIPDRPKDPFDAVNHGYEVQIDNTDNEYHRTGCLYSLTKAINNVDARTDAWNTMMITLEGPRTRVEVNGKPVTDYTEGQPVPPKKEWYEPDRGRRPDEGYIGLQNHGAGMFVHFKEVSVRALTREKGKREQ